MKQLSVVIIGLNVEKWIEGAIRSVINQDYQPGISEIIYVDSGSTDSTLNLVRQWPMVKILQLKGGKPSAARARNTGLKSAANPIVQLLDGDSWLHPSWLSNAVPHLKEKTAAVTGLLHERNPGKNWMHMVTDVDWQIIKAVNMKTGESSVTRSFGGNVLVNRNQVLQAGGYDENLLAGEDPDLSYRLRKAGAAIVQLNVSMASHDINMSRAAQWWKRAKRTGEVFAILGKRYRKEKEQLYLRETLRVLIQSFMLPVSLVADIVLFGFPVSIVPAFLLTIRPLISPSAAVRHLQLPGSIRFLYGFHLATVVFPQSVGVLSAFFSKKGFRP